MRNRRNGGTIEVDAREFEQSGTKLYSFVMTGADVFRVSTISRREDDKELGYQRMLNRNRAMEIASYVDHRHGLLPNNLILAFKESVRYSQGKLHIPVEPDAALVIDGQHRLWGLHLAKADFQVAVVGFIGLDLVRQKELFITINKFQKGVPTSLFLDLLPEIKDLVGVDVAQERAIDLVKGLNVDEDSPWYQQINLTGEGRGAISLANFVRKLKPLLGQPSITRLLYGEQYQLLFNYFTAVKTVFLEQWNDGRSLIKKTVGFGALMGTLPEMFVITTREKGEFTVSAIRDVLSLVDSFRFDKETLGAGSGTAAEREGTERLLNAIDAQLRVAKETEGKSLIKF